MNVCNTHEEILIKTIISLLLLFNVHSFIYTLIYKYYLLLYKDLMKLNLNTRVKYMVITYVLSVVYIWVCKYIMLDTYYIYISEKLYFPYHKPALNPN